MTKESTPEVWNQFWQSRQAVDKVYPSSPAVMEAILSHLHPEGLKVLEVRAGAGRN